MLARTVNRILPGTKNRPAPALFLLITAIYYLKNFAVGQVPGKDYVLPAFLWGFVVFAVLRLPSRRAAAKQRYQALFCRLALLCALFGTLALYAAGLLGGFGRSPYDLSCKGILVNIFYLGPMVAGMELSRAWFLHVLWRKRPLKGIVLASLFYTFFWFTLNRMMNITAGLEAAKFIGSIYLPALSENVLASYLAFWGGALPAIIYRGTLLALHWFLPVLPDLGWITQAFLGTFMPVCGLVFTHQVFWNETPSAARKNSKTGSPFSWIATSIICVLLIWFSVGVFSIFPTVIVSGSMSPQIGVGDIVIISKKSAASINVGDVLHFKEGQVRVAHRVVEVGQDETGGKIFWTKGDANKNRDTEPVLPEQVVGTVVYTVPKAGWITIWLRSIKN